MIPATIVELKKWMSDHCYNEDYFIIMQKPQLFQGYVLDYEDYLYRWYYTERGSLEIIKTFEIEKDAVDFAFSKISSSESARQHMIGFLPDKVKIKELLDELKRRNIKYELDEIPYNDEFKTHTRVFIFGCDINKAGDLKDNYIDNN